MIEHKFFFVFFQFEKDTLVLKKVKFWNMPYLDIEECEKVWQKTQKTLISGKIVKEIKFDKNGKEKRLTNFPNKKFSDISHVRPHALNSEDVYLLPNADKITKVNEYTKHCFWLNNTYVRDKIYL